MQFGQLGLNGCSLVGELAPAQPYARRWPIESVVAPPDRPVAAHGGAWCLVVAQRPASGPLGWLEASNRRALWQRCSGDVDDRGHQVATPRDRKAEASPFTRGLVVLVGGLLENDMQ
jgi:hypothetical protein